MKVHSATCSCSVELYKLWYALADFLSNWDISRGFLLLPLFCRKDQRSCDSFIRGGEIREEEIEEGGCE